MTSFFNKNKNLIIGILSFIFVASLIGGTFIFQQFQSDLLKPNPETLNSNSQSSQKNSLNTLDNTSNTVVDQNQSGQNNLPQNLNRQSQNSSSTSLSNTNISNTNPQSNQTNSQNPLPQSENRSQNQPNQNIQTYTNPAYPNLKINYNDSWKIERSNLADTYFTGLMSGVIKLKKPNQEMTFTLSPLSLSSCGGKYGPYNGSSGIYLKERVEVNNDFYREMWYYKAEEVSSNHMGTTIKHTPTDAFEYSTKKNKSNPNFTCNNDIIIKTNMIAREVIKGSVDDDWIKILYPNPQDKVIYIMTIDYKGDPTTFDQADEIIRNSVFE